ncbi:MAG: hypothetical protein ACRYFS_08160 [Janthinobacterium lividum]
MAFSIAEEQLVTNFPDANEDIEEGELADAVSDVEKAITKHLVSLLPGAEMAENFPAGTETAVSDEDRERFASEELPGGSGGNSGSQVTPGYWEQGRERKAAEAHSEFLERMCNQDNDVRDFRRRVFGKEDGIDLVRGVRFITSSLAKVLSVEQFLTFNPVPFGTLGMLGVRTEGKWQPVRADAPLLVRSESSRHFMKRKQLPEQAEFIAAVFDIAPSKPVNLRSRLLVLPTAGYVGVHRPSSLHYGDAANADAVFHFTPQRLPVPAFVPFLDETRYFEGLEGSVAAEALRVCERIMTSCPIDVWEALKFLVTSHLSIPTMSGRLFAYGFPTLKSERRIPQSALGLVRLEFQPWLTPKELADYWRGIRGNKSNGIKHQLPTEEDIDLFRFMLARTPPGHPPQWKWLWEEWKKSQEAMGQPVERVPNNPSDRMKKVFNAVHEALFPGYGG